MIRSRHEEKDMDDLFDCWPEIKNPPLKTQDDTPRLRKPELRLELKLKQRNRKKIANNVIRK